MLSGESSRWGQSEHSISRAIESAKRARNVFIDLTHEMPEGAPRDILDAWTKADAALFEFIKLLEAERGW